jgi:CcmD family protein
LAAAYIVVWVLAIGYLWTIWRRLGSVEKELAEALRRVGETDGA